VYLKGCPLRCLWCHSPESQSFQPEIVWYETRCRECGACVEVCPEGIRKPGLIEPAERARCRLCGTCARACPANALELKGREVTAGEMLDEACRLKPFFGRTGGGVTITGGEPTAQPEFARALGLLCRQADIHVAMETCGFTKPEVLDRLAEAVDLFLYDLKHHDDALHREYTGVSNERIFSNLKRLLAGGAEVIVRVPLIPGLNDAPDTVREIARTAAEAGADRISLLPFNPATPGKYSWIQQPGPLPDATRQDDAALEELERIAADEGLAVVAS
jgi:pyruvate formate lyase activating enzyme